MPPEEPRTERLEELLRALERLDELLEFLLVKCFVMGRGGFRGVQAIHEREHALERTQEQIVVCRGLIADCFPGGDAAARASLPSVELGFFERVLFLVARVRVRRVRAAVRSVRDAATRSLRSEGG